MPRTQPASNKKGKMKVAARIQQVENGFIVTVEYQKLDSWEEKQYVAFTDAEAKARINDAFKELKKQK